MMYSKHISKILSLALIVFLSGVLVEHAAGYAPLAPLPIGGVVTDSPTGYESMGAYLAGMIKFLIAVGGVIAIVMAIIGGVQYIASGITPSGKEAAKKRIGDAFVGLVLILASYLILNSINPDLVKLNLDLTPIKGERRATTTMAVGRINGQRTPWGDDSAVRKALPPFVTVKENKRNCTYIGDSGCTSLTGLSATVVNGLTGLASACKCNIYITGGTEYWLHGNRAYDIEKNPTGHKPDGSVVDLSKNSNVTPYIEKNGKSISGGCSSGKHYKIGNDIYVDETLGDNAPHWHVCYGGGRGGSEDMSQPYINPTYGETASDVTDYLGY